jgi:hypothetical protein
VKINSLNKNIYSNINIKYNSNKITSDFDTVIENVIKTKTDNTISSEELGYIKTISNLTLLPEKENTIKFNLKGNFNFKKLVTPRRDYNEHYINDLKKSTKDEINNYNINPVNEKNQKWER